MGLEQLERKAIIRLVPGLRMCRDIVPFPQAFTRLGTGPTHLQIEDEFAIETTRQGASVNLCRTGMKLQCIVWLCACLSVRAERTALMDGCWPECLSRCRPQSEGERQIFGYS